MEKFGDIKDFKFLCTNWLIDSNILNREECLSLVEMKKSTKKSSVEVVGTGNPSLSRL